MSLERRLFGEHNFSDAQVWLDWMRPPSTNYVAWQLDAVMWGMSALRCGQPGDAIGLEERAGAILRVVNR